MYSSLCLISSFEETLLFSNADVAPTPTSTNFKQHLLVS